MPNLKQFEENLVLIGEFGPCYKSYNGFPTPSRYVCRVPYGEPKRLLHEHKLIRAATKNNRLFILADSGNELVCAGEARLAEFASVKLEIEFVFTLSKKLNRALWAELGGYSTWLVNIGGKGNKLFSTAQELQEILESIKAARVKVFVTRYEEDVFELYLQGNKAVAVYVNSNKESFVSTSSFPENRKRLVRFRLPDDNYEFFESHVVSKDEAFQLLTGFVREGFPTGLIGFSIPKA